MIKITFLGAANTVTGSMTLVEVNGAKYLVDCGLIQGEENVEMEQSTLAFDPSELAGVFLTHAHVDHSGYLPAIFKLGFRGKVYCSIATSKLIQPLLLDSARLQADSANPLYNEQDAIGVMSLIKSIDFDQELIIHEVAVTFYRAGHILGAASIYFKDQNQSVLFSGDLGRRDDVIMPAPQVPPVADVVIAESTYGDRNRENSNLMQEFFEVIDEAIANNKILIIASFALARAQLFAYCISSYIEKRPQTKNLFYFDSPLMKEMSKIYKNFSDEFLPQKKAFTDSINEMHFVEGHKWSEGFKHKKPPFILIASSGMLNGGPVIKYLKMFLDRQDCTVFLPGFQARTTLGAELLAHKKEVKLPHTHETITVRAEIRSSVNFSSHADQNDLLFWISHVAKANTQVYLNHGDELAKVALKEQLSLQKISAKIAQKSETIIIS